MLDYLLGLVSIFSNISRFTSCIGINKGYAEGFLFIMVNKAGILLNFIMVSKIFFILLYLCIWIQPLHIVRCCNFYHCHSFSIFYCECTWNYICIITVLNFLIIDSVNKKLWPIKVWINDHLSYRQMLYH